MSAFVILPFSAEPFICVKSMPFSLAIDFANGEALILISESDRLVFFTFGDGDVS